jgi:hypothetical protein
MTGFVVLAGIPAPFTERAGVALPFAESICALSLVQAATVLMPAARELPLLARFRSGWWALIPAASVVGFVFAVNALGGIADGLAYLALLAVPPLAAVALGWLVRGARPRWAALAPLLFAIAWVDRGGLAAQAATVALEVLSCVTLGVLLVAVTPRRLVKVGILAMAAADAWLVFTNELTAPNNSLNAVMPLAHLPQLQRVQLHAAVMGYGDIFIAALLGALLAAEHGRQRRAALLAAALALAWNLLFFGFYELPATVPIALTLIALELGGRRSRRLSDAAPRPGFAPATLQPAKRDRG